MRNCIKCQSPISLGRLNALPDTKTCVLCSNINRVKGHRIISGKNTYSELQILPADHADQLAKLQMRKGQGVSNGVKFHK